MPGESVMSTSENNGLAVPGGMWGMLINKPQEPCATPEQVRQERRTNNANTRKTITRSLLMNSMKVGMPYGTTELTELIGRKSSDTVRKRLDELVDAGILRKEIVQITTVKPCIHWVRVKK